MLRRFQALLDGQYRIERELGRGGMATVYLAKDLRHGREVAIKLLQPELTTAVTAERFLREIQIIAKLQHPHILTLIDSGARDGLVYYVMPHVEGESLRERLLWEKQLPVEQAVQIARQVALALAHAHGHGVVHRDIKPENILLSGGQAILADFGIARAVREIGQQSITQVGLPIGTPAYMSPEQVAGDPIDARTDLYALGCVLFEMVAGRPPFVASTVVKVMEMQLSEPPPSVCACRTAAPAEMDEIIRRSLAKDRQARFQSATEFAEALGLIEATETLERSAPTGARRVATPPSLPIPPGGTPSGLKRVLVLGGAVGALLIAALSVARYRGPSPAPVEPPKVSGLGSPEYLASIGVRPLDPIGEAGAQTISAGITEELSAQLSKIKQLKVISRTTMEAVRAKGWTTRQVADSLGIRYLLEGSVQQSGKELVVTLQLIDAVSDGHLWGDSYRQPLRDILMIRQVIAGKAIEALALQVPGLKLVKADTGSMVAEAVQALAHGIELKSGGDEGRLDESIRSFERALALDSTYAAAAAGLSDALLNYVALGFRKREPYGALADAIRWGDRAVVLDPQLARAWAARGAARMAAGVRPSQAFADLERAVALAPSDGPIRVSRGIALGHLGRYDEAVKEMETAAALDPLNAITRGGGLAVTALAARRYDLVIREARLAAARDPSFPGWPVLEALGLLLSGKPAQCIAMKLADFGAAVTAICLERQGDRVRARQIVDSIEASSIAGPLGIYTMGFLGAYHAVVGDAAKAISWIEKAYAVSPAGFDPRLFRSELFDKVRVDPTFARGWAAVQARVRARFS